MDYILIGFGVLFLIVFICLLISSFVKWVNGDQDDEDEIEEDLPLIQVNTKLEKGWIIGVLDQDIKMSSVDFDHCFIYLNDGRIVYVKGIPQVSAYEGDTVQFKIDDKRNLLDFINLSSGEQ